MTPATRWRKLFERDGYHTELVEHVIEEQVAFELNHPIPYDNDQRLRALIQRAERVHGAALPRPVAAMLARAAAEWPVAVPAAEET